MPLERASTAPEAPLAGIIFDLDGTITDTLPIAFSAFRAALAAFTNRRFTDAELIAFFGPTEDGILRRILPQEWELCFARYLHEYTSRHAACSAPFPGMLEVLDFLKMQRVPIALVTGKAPQAVAITLKHVAIADYFDVMEMGSPEGGVKPQALRRVVDRWGFASTAVAYVGDACSDMQAANQIGAVAVGAAWAATEDPAMLKASGASVVFTHIGDFFAWLRARTECAPCRIRSQE